MLATDLAKAYRSWVNDYLTIARFAADHDLTEADALVIIDLGRRYHEEGW